MEITFSTVCNSNVRLNKTERKYLCETEGTGYSDQRNEDIAGLRLEIGNAKEYSGKLVRYVCSNVCSVLVQFLLGDSSLIVISISS